MVVASFRATTIHAQLQIVLWLLPVALESAIVLAMLYRKLWHELPIFLSYLLYSIFRTTFLFLERNHEWVYFYAYWIMQAIGCFAALWVIRELFDDTFHVHLGLHHLGRNLFRWSILLLLITAVLIAWMSPGDDKNRMMAGIFVLKRTVTVVEAGLLAFLFIFAFSFGLAWRQYAVGISLGFGLYGAVELIALAIRMHYGHAVQGIYNWMMLTINNCCVLIWASYLLFPVKLRGAEVDLDRARELLQEWNHALLLTLRR